MTNRYETPHTAIPTARLAAAEARAERWKADAERLMDAIDALEGLLACHRVGKAPTEKQWTRLDKKNEARRLHNALLAEEGES